MAEKFKNLSEYVTYTHQLLREQGLGDWRVAWFTSVAKCGRAKTRDRKIELNRDYFWLTQDHEQLINTCRHEVAHALNHERGGRGHDKQWRTLFINLGGDGERCNCSLDCVMPTMGTRGRAEERSQFEID